MNFEIDHSLTVFTSEGKLSQCDSALTASLNGALSVAACAPDGCVLTSLKKGPKLAEKSKIYKIAQVCSSIGITYAGLQADYRIMAEKAMQLAEEYKDVYGRYPYVDAFVGNFSRVIQEYTQKGRLRPFGVMLLVAGYAPVHGTVQPLLYQMDPSGSFQQVAVAAIGKEYSEALKFVERRVEKVDDNIFSCVSALREYAGYNITYEDVDVGVFLNASKEFRIYKAEEVKEVFESK